MDQSGPKLNALVQALGHAYELGHPLPSRRKAMAHMPTVAPDLSWTSSAQVGRAIDELRRQRALIPQKETTS